MKKQFRGLVIILAGTAFIPFVWVSLGDAGSNLFWETGVLANTAVSAACGEKAYPLTFYQNLSTYSLVIGFIFLFAAIFVDKKAIKLGFAALVVFPFGVWVYVNYLVNFDEVKRLIYTYNAAAETQLANIAEAQDRYKSEQDTFLAELDKLYSHMAGAHGGSNPCVRVLKIEAGFNHWSAEAKHVNSPDTVSWSNRSGSSLKKG